MFVWLVAEKEKVLGALHCVGCFAPSISLALPVTSGKPLFQWALRAFEDIPVRRSGDGCNFTPFRHCDPLA